MSEVVCAIPERRAASGCGTRKRSCILVERSRVEYDAATSRETSHVADRGDPHNASAQGTEPTTLLEQVAAGDPSAVRVCLDRFGGLVWSLARRALPTRSEAEDAVQEIFVDVWRSAPRYDPSIASESAFVAMIARRRLIDRQRKSGRRPNEEAIQESAGAESSPPDASTLTDADASAASEAFKQLSDEQQRVLRLSIFHGLSHEKIARATDLPLGTVKTHARRGLIRLRELMGASPTAEGGVS